MDTIEKQFRDQFLQKIKDVAKKDRNGNLFKINLYKDKNLIFLMENNLGLEEIKQIILNLKNKDCYKGPEEDRGKYSGYILIYKPYFEGRKIYVKIRYDKNKAICISIHEDEIDEEDGELL